MITKTSRVEEIISQTPDKVKIFVKFGLPCLVCGEPFWGTLEELCEKYKVDVNLLLEHLNQDENKGV
ncbi:MAG: DUF1858 domain-containing protein [candidate division WOR-3 bacterium]